MITTLKKHWPFYLVILILMSSVAILAVLSIVNNHGNFGYTNDDVYIHMAIAKNIVLHGVWGVDRYKFVSSTSSPLWIVILSSAYFIFGVHEFIAFYLNIFLAIIFVYVIYYLLKKYSLPPLVIFISLLAILFFTPTIPMIFGGMEHILHALLTILFVSQSSKILTSDEVEKKDINWLLILALLVSSIRYEGLFMVLVTCVLFAFRKRFLSSILLGIFALIPVVIFGLFSMFHGGYFLPSTLLLKGNFPSLSLYGIVHFFHLGYWLILANQHVFSLLLISALLFVIGFDKHKTYWKGSMILLITFFTTTLLHMLFAKTGWQYRYEAYLVSLGIFVISISLWDYMPAKSRIFRCKRLWPVYLVLAYIVFVIIHPIFNRSYHSLIVTQGAIKNIYDQQRQMGLFLNQYYRGENVAANDIGAVNFLADINCFDMVGLGNHEVTNAMLSGKYTTKLMNDLTKQSKVKIAVIYTNWFDIYGGLPPNWEKVGVWKIQKNIINGVDSVCFYAVDSLERKNLIRNLNAFSAYLPKDVIQSGEYTNENSY